MGGVVYFIRFGTSGPIKIGTSVDVRKRLRDLDCGPECLTLLGTVPGNQRLEKQIHAALVRHKLRLEWFRPAPEVLSFIERALEAPANMASLIEERSQELQAHIAKSRIDALTATAAANWAVDRLCTREGLSLVAEVAGVSDDQISKYRHQRSQMGVVALLRLQAQWPEDFALFEMLSAIPNMSATEVCDNRPQLEAARDAIDAQLRKLVVAA